MIVRMAATIIVNGIGLYASTALIDGFIAPTDLKSLAVAAIVFTIINAFIKPVLNIVLSPFIFLTLGFAVLVINGGMLYLLDYLLPTVTITGLKPLIYATLLISVINIIIGGESP